MSRTIEDPTLEQLELFQRGLDLLRRHIINQMPTLEQLTERDNKEALQKQKDDETDCAKIVVLLKMLRSKIELEYAVAGDLARGLK